MKAKTSVKRDVKVIQIPHGIFGRPLTRAIRRHIIKWGKKGYRLEQQNDQKPGCGGGGYTLLTFIRDEE